MVSKGAREHSEKSEQGKTDTSGDTRSGNPNPDNPNEHRSTEHKSGYGGDRGMPRPSSDETQGKE